MAAIGLLVSALIVMGAVHSSNTSWNVNSRMALVFAIVDRGTFAVDEYVGEDGILPSGDKAAFGGRIYSDKAFGVSLVCVPVYAAMQMVARLFGFEWGLPLKIYILRVVSASIPAAISLVLLWRLMVRAGANPRRALGAVAIAFCGSMWFAYSTLAMPYSLGIACCLGATYVLCQERPGSMRSSRAAAIGFLCGFAVITDFLFAPIVVIAIAIVFVLRMPINRLDRASLLGASAALGAAVPLASFGAYTYSIFGALGLPYQYEVEPLFREGMSRGLMGIATPRLGPMWFLTLHPYRGVLFWSPWIAIALAGCVMAAKRTGLRRTFGWMGLWAFGSALLINSGYYMWWGGFTMGPRLMLPMMAAVPLGLAEACRDDRSSLWWKALLFTGAISFALSMPLALTEPQMEQIEDTADLLKVVPSTSLRVPQFEYLRLYYRGDWFREPHSKDQLPLTLPPLAIALAGVILIRTARRLPQRAADLPA